MPSEYGNIIDSQKSKLYKAEGAIPRGRSFASIEECQAYVDRILRRDYLQRHYDCSPITVTQVYGHRRATAYPVLSEVTFPKWARHESVVLHEVAHVLAWRRYNRGTDTHHTYPGHDWTFVSTLMDLVRNVLGRDAEQAFRQACKTRKVRYRAKRPVTEAQRAAWSKSLEKAAAKLKENQTDA